MYAPELNTFNYNASKARTFDRVRNGIDDICADIRAIVKYSINRTVSAYNDSFEERLTNYTQLKPLYIVWTIK